MLTIRNILKELTDCVDFNESHYDCSCVFLVFADGKSRNFATLHDNDKRYDMGIVLGKGFSSFKNNHIKTIYCFLPRELATPDIEQYRDTTDPHMYKYRIPEREFNSLLSQLPISLDKTIEANRNSYSFYGYEWDGHDNWKRKVNEWYGWNIL